MSKKTVQEEIVNNVNHLMTVLKTLAYQKVIDSDVYENLLFSELKALKHSADRIHLEQIIQDEVSVKKSRTVSNILSAASMLREGIVLDERVTIINEGKQQEYFVQLIPV